jgi:hypothetical protein
MVPFHGNNVQADALQIRLLHKLPQLLEVVGNCNFRNENTTAFIRATNPKVDVATRNLEIRF